MHCVVGEFRRNKIVQSAPEAYFSVGRQLQRGVMSHEGDYSCFLWDKQSQSTDRVMDLFKLSNYAVTPHDESMTSDVFPHTKICNIKITVY